MTRLENLKSRVKALAPVVQREGDLVGLMSDEEIERRAREILGRNTNHLDPDLVRQARHISDRRVRS